jgi:hypothetical protein
MRHSPFAHDAAPNLAATCARDDPTKFAIATTSVDRSFKVAIFEHASTNCCASISQSLRYRITLRCITIDHDNRSALR